MEYIQLTETNQDLILELFNKSVDNKGFIVEKRTKRKLVCPYSKEPIRITDFSILPGSAIFVNNKSYCFAEHVTMHK